MSHINHPTMKDVAREAGVSLGTVSRVFNGADVGEDYRRRVEEASARLGYQVNNYARGLKLNHSFSVALLLPSLRHPFFAMLADGLVAALSRQGYRAVLMITNYEPEAEQKCFTLAQSNKVDGIIALSYSSNLKVEPSLPVVTIDRSLDAGLPCVSSDNFRGGQMAAEKLLELGCKKLLFLRIGSAIRGEVDRRGPGFEEVCRREGVHYEKLLVNESETEAPIYRYLETHLKEGVFAFDGIFCNTDGLCIRVCNWLTEHGIIIPDDVQVIGYDGITDFADGTYVCSTIVQPIAQMAEKAVELLLDRMGNASSPISPLIYRIPVSYAAGGTTREPYRSANILASPQLYDPFRKVDS